MDPAERRPQRRHHSAVLVVNNDKPPAVLVGLIQQCVEVDGLGPRLNIANAAAFTFDIEQPGKLRAQVVDIFTQPGRDVDQPRVVLSDRLLEDDSELAIYFALTLLSSTLS